MAVRPSFNLKVSITLRKNTFFSNQVMVWAWVMAPDMVSEVTADTEARKQIVFSCLMC